MTSRLLFPAGAVASLLFMAALTLSAPSPGVAVDCPPCNDNVDCTIDACDTATGTCTHTTYSCDDQNQCTLDFCTNNGGCNHATGPSFCEDGDPCTINQCRFGGCAVEGYVHCDDGNICTGDICQSGVGCVFAPRDGGCSDGNACTAGDLCVNGACQPGTSVSCNDGNVCTQDSCDPGSGCHAANVSGSCDDGRSCTVNDACVAGVCTGAGSCPCPDADADGFHDCASIACDASGQTCGDCDDANASIHPGVVDVCDHLDNDCDGTVDEGSAKTWETQGVDDPAGGSAGDRYGAAIAKLGDVTGDGVDDLAMGAPTTDTGSAVDAGSVVVLSGADGTVHCRAVDAAGLASDRLGQSVAGIDDVTGDGIPDLVAGAPGGTSPNSTGRVVVISGADCAVVRSCTDSVITPSPEGPVQTYVELGATLVPAGDVDGDGFEDILAGDPLSRHTVLFPDGTGLHFFASGRAVIFSGANCAVLRRLPSPNLDDNARFGSSLANLGDLNGDGVDDFAIGMPSSPNSYGKVFLYSGATGALVRTLQDTAPEASYGLFGTAIGVLPDVNGDGTVDLAVGEAAGDAGGLTDSGSVVLFSGADGSFLRRCTAPDGAPGDALGTAIAVLPDVNGDGRADIATSAALDDVGPLADAGSIAIFSSADCGLLARLPYGGAGAVGGARLGETGLTLAGNLAGDPTDDLVAGYGYNAASADNAPGHAIVFHLESECGTGECVPDGPEACDGRDNDCDGAVDEGNPGGGLSCATPKPGICAAGTTSCFGGNIACLQNVQPAPETCNGLDDNCDGVVPANEADADGDGFSVCNGDCDDASPARHPGANEVCDLVDDDCDGVLEPDADGDGHVDCLDCQPADPLIPAPESCNGLDDDCNGTVPANEADADGDGFRVCGGDCDDASPARHPGANEVCDLVDDDCDGVLEPDADGDGHLDCMDCQPADPLVWAAPPELSNVQAVLDSGMEFFTWDDPFNAAGIVVYDVFSGSLRTLRTNPGHFSTGSCAASDLSFYAYESTNDIPPSGDGFYYIVRGRNACGTGTYGSALRDQGAASSPLPCP